MPSWRHERRMRRMLVPAIAVARRNTDGMTTFRPMDDSKLRVCHVIHRLAPGGAEHVLTALALAAPRAGLELSVLSLMPTTGHHYARILTELGVDVRSLDLRSRWDPRGFSRGLETIRDLRPKVLHTHLKHADLIGSFVSRRLGLPMVSTLHIMEEVRDPRRRAERWLAAQVRMRTADRTIAVSEGVRRWYLRTFPADPVTVVKVHNGVMAPRLDLGPEARRRIRGQLGVPPQAVMATMISLLRPGKGHTDLITAASRLPEALDVHIVIVGDGPLRPALEAQARALGLKDRRVHFTGYRTDVGTILACSDIVVQPSLFDALPTALIEGLAAGLPAIASEVGGIVDIVTADLGILVPPASPDRLAESLIALARDPERGRRMGQAARRRFEQQFDAVNWAGTLRRLYDEVLGGSSTSAGAVQRGVDPGDDGSGGHGEPRLSASG
jgi:glycosyltransferase involved in cell wall biosynthesis